MEQKNVNSCAKLAETESPNLVWVQSTRENQSFPCVPPGATMQIYQAVRGFVMVGVLNYNLAI